MISYLLPLFHDFYLRHSYSFNNPFLLNSLRICNSFLFTGCFMAYFPGPLCWQNPSILKKGISNSIHYNFLIINSLLFNSLYADKTRELKNELCLGCLEVFSYKTSFPQRIDIKVKKRFLFPQPSSNMFGFLIGC